MIFEIKNVNNNFYYIIIKLNINNKINYIKCALVGMVLTKDAYKGPQIKKKSI